MMKKKYLIKKDENRGLSSDNWLVLSGKEFYEYVREGRFEGRYVMELCHDEWDDEIIYIECNADMYRIRKKELNHQYYERRKRKEDDIPRDLSYLDVITDDSMYFPGPEEAYIEKELYFDAGRVLKELTEFEKTILMAGTGKENRFEDAIKKTGLSKGQIRYRRIVIHNRVKNSLR